MSPLRILIVDDTPVTLRLLRAQLEAEGYLVASASNGTEALKVLESEDVDVIISDILMPEMDGYRLCHEVRRSQRYQNLPFIFHTATYTSPSDEKLSASLGADRFLRKPVSIEDLLTAIRETVLVPHRGPFVSMEPMDVLKSYSERLVSKLEEKNVELTEAVNKIDLQTTALETAADAMLIADVKGTILWVNNAFVTMTGYGKEEAIGKTPRILKSGKHDAAFYREFWETIREGRVWRGEFTNRRKDGTLCYDEHTVTPMRGEDGEITHFVGVLHEITERKQAEQNLRDAHAQLRQLLEHSPVVIYALGIEGEAIVPRLASENVTRLLGFTVEETLSYEWWLGRLHPDDREMATESIAETLRYGMSRTEYRLRHKDGSWRWVEDSRRLIRDERGEPAELVGVWTDITDRRRAEDELRMSERRFSNMLKNLHLISMMLDRDGRITYCNDHLLRITGWRREELLGRNWFDTFIPPEIADEVKGVFSTLLTDRPESWHHENEMLTRSGERRLIRWSNSALRSPSGGVIGTASIGEDITDQRSLEKQLYRAQRLESLGTLASGIAHDLNNLFMPILMGAELMKKLEPSAPSQKAIRNIETCIARATDLVRQVLLFARGAEGPQVRIDLAEVISEVEAIVASTFPKNVTFTTSIARPLPPIKGDLTQLTQVALNLCVNARDAMPAGGRITLSARPAELSNEDAMVHGGTAGDRYVVLEVIDNGSGMPQNVIDRVFEPFFTTKAIGQGTGLGLSTSMGIVRSHGGFLAVTSEEGNGSTFSVYIPSPSERPAATAMSEAGAGQVQHGNGELILVVDDETAILDVAKQSLETFGYQVLTATDGAKGIETYVRFRSKCPVVITDMMMPVVDGATLIAALLRIDPDTRIIAASGLGDTVLRLKALEAGAHRFLAKPFSVDTLLRAVSDELLSGGGMPPVSPA
jgi:PAS domain S-box-containing protein